MANGSRELIPDSRSRVRKRTVAKSYGSCARHTEDTGVSGGTKLSGRGIDMENFRKIDRKVRVGKELKQRLETLCCIREEMGSQWRFLRRGVTWSCFLARKTSFAAAFCTFCNLSKSFCGMLQRRELQ